MRPVRRGRAILSLALALIPFSPPGVPIIAASAACLLGWRGK